MATQISVSICYVYKQSKTAVEKKAFTSLTHFTLVHLSISRSVIHLQFHSVRNPSEHRRNRKYIYFELGDRIGKYVKGGIELEKSGDGSVVRADGAEDLL
ncbi:hypothetical protein QQ045_033675 [Rhodiola kirilowii]